MKTSEDQIEELYLGKLVDQVGFTYALAFKQTNSPGLRAEICQTYTSMCIFMSETSFIHHEDAVPKGTNLVPNNPTETLELEYD